MSIPGPVFAWGSVSEDIALFKALDSEQRSKTFDAMVRQDLVRGESLPIAELRAGELVGEIGFFANLPRTANVIAIRDTSVLALTRAAYQTLAEATPAITESLLGALALRFAKRTERIPTIRTSPMARTVALINGGRAPIPDAFYRHMRDALGRIDAQIVDPARVSSMFPGRALDASEVTDWLNNLEQIAPLVIYLGSDEVPAWTRKAIRQADMVVFACQGDAPSEPLTEIEAFACQVHPVSARRIVRITMSRSRTRSISTA
jgi:NTE family protein